MSDASSGEGDNAKNNAAAVSQFLRLLELYSYKREPIASTKRLTNFTFFAGAGFSKSWDPKAPIGAELFDLKTDVIEEIADVGVLFRTFGLNGLTRVTPEQLRQMVYQVDMYERYPDIRPRYVDEQNLEMFRGGLRAAVVDRYETITNLNYFDRSINKFPLASPTSAQQNILGLFGYLHSQIDGSDGLAEGIRTHFVTTNYDYVVETILDNVLNADDSLFLYAYRGFTPREIVDSPNVARVHEHWLVQHILKINGGFEILRRADGYALDYSKRPTATVTGDPPILMLASREQDYSDPYFKTVFPKAVRLMRDTQVLIIVGYSLPPDDALIRFIIRQLAEEPEDGLEKVIFYISPGTSEQKHSVLREVFPAMSLHGSPRVVPYNGGFDTFAAECLRATRPK